MARYPLASNSDWELQDDDQDIRGWTAYDGDKNRLGEVTHMFMNTETEMVDVIRLDSGREITAKDVHIGKEAIYCDIADPATLPPAVTVRDDCGRLVRRVVVPDATFTLYESQFRKHYADTFVGEGWVYEFYLPGYRYGYTLAAQGSNAGKSYEQVEAEARLDFVSRHGDTEYETHREAIRYGYETHRAKLLAA